jgi:hypothetical protein
MSQSRHLTGRRMHPNQGTRGGSKATTPDLEAAARIRIYGTRI